MVIALPPAVAPTALPSGVAATAVISRTNPAPYGWTTHVVRSGDTVSAIAAAHRTTIGALVARNHLPSHGRIIHPGQRLQVPRTGPAPKAAVKKPAPAPARAATPKAAPATGTTTYLIRPGDSLSVIAVARQTTVARLLKLNRLSIGSTIYAGQRLTVPAPAHPAAPKKATPKPAPAKPAPAKAASARTHKVVSGDTLSGLALRYHTTVGELQRANRLSSTLILRGQILTVPGAAAQPATKPAAAPTPAKPATTPQSSAPIPTRSEARDLIVRIARQHGVDPKLALAIGWQESGWNQRAHSHANAHGIMQVIPDAGDWASSLIGRKLDLYQAEDNVTAGVVILRALGRMTTSQDEAIASYYQGFTSVRTRGWYLDTKQYVANINALRARM